MSRAPDWIAGCRWHLALGALAAGLALAQAPPLAAGGSAVCLVLAGPVLRAPRWGVLAAAALLVGVAVGEERLRATEPIALEGRFVGDAEVLERPRAGPFDSSAAVRVADGPARGARLHARLGGGRRWPAAAQPGSLLRVSGALRAPRRSATSDFDWPAHLERRGIATELVLTSVEPTGRRRAGVAGVVDSLRRRAESGLGRGMTSAQSALSRGMVLGQDEGIDDLVRDDFRASGLAHVLAVSGQNVMLLSMLALPVLAAAGLGLRGRTLALMALIALYVPLAGAGPSLQRAGVMGTAALVALLAGRPASRWYALLLAAVVTLAANPRACGDVGWQLSFAAVAGILLLAPRLRTRLPLPRLLAEGVAVTVAATLATGPLLAHHFGAVSLASLPANIAALPLVAPIMWLGMLQAALGGVVASGIGFLNGHLLDALAWLAARFAEEPWAQVEVTLRSAWAVAGAYLVLAGACALALRRRGSTDPAGTALGHETRLTWRVLPRSARALAVATGAAALLLAAQAVVARPQPPERLTVSFLDVGQGDATLIQHPDSSAVLFDGGPARARVARLLERAGVRRLSAVVATHASADHHGGLPEVLDRFPVDLLVDGGDGSPDPTFRALVARADRKGVRRVTAQAGRVFRAGALEVEVLSPQARAPGPAPEDPNPRAVVALVRSGAFDLFLSADAESPSLLPLDLPDVEAMKVPHHGSRDPGLPAVLARLRPEIAVIEVGKGNTYGHPAQETVAALARAVPEVRRTDESGTVKVEVDRDRMRVSAGR